MGNWLAGFEKWFGGGPGGSKRLRTLMWLILIGLLGAALMIMNSFLNVKDVESIDKNPHASLNANQTVTASKSGVNDQTSMFREYEDAYEIRLRDILQKIVGVGEVEVLVSIDSTEETVVDKNYQDSQSMTNERDNGGVTRSISEQTRQGESVMVGTSGEQRPLVLKYTRPKVRGVIIVAKGADNLAIKKMIVEAVERGIDVPAHRISVLPRKQ